MSAARRRAPLRRAARALRGLSRQIEQVNLDLLAERLGRVEDLELMVDLISTGMAESAGRRPRWPRCSSASAAASTTVLDKLDLPLQVTVERPHRSGVRDLFKPTGDDAPPAAS